MAKGAANNEDGRTARRDRNTDAVLDAVHEMFIEGNFSPAVDEVAARSGVSLRSVYRYFEDSEALVRMAIERRIALVGDLYELPDLGEGSREQRVKNLVNQRLRLHSKLAPSIRAAMLRAPFSDPIAAQVQDRRGLLARQTQAQFAPELELVERGRRAELAACIDALCSFEAIDQLRVRAGLSVTRTRRSLVDAAMAILDASAGAER